MTIANKQARLTFWAAALGVTNQYYKGVKMSQVNFVREVRHLGDAMYDEWIEHVDDEQTEERVVGLLSGSMSCEACPCRKTCTTSDECMENLLRYVRENK